MQSLVDGDQSANVEKSLVEGDQKWNFFLMSLHPLGSRPLQSLFFT